MPQDTIGEAVKFSVTNWKSTVGKVIRLEEGDITLVEADAIVNAANSRLSGGAGVDGAIHKAAGSSVMTELDGIRAKMGKCAPGEAVVTKAGRLKAQFIFHAVGPVYRGGEEGEPDERRGRHPTGRSHGKWSIAAGPTDPAGAVQTDADGPRSRGSAMP